MTIALPAAVNSYTEWGPLREVILGSHYNTTVGDLDLSMELLFHDNLVRARRKHPGHHYTIKKQYIDEREEDTAELAGLLTARGIVTRRPALLTNVKKIVTPYWESVTKACDNPRDRTLIVGDRIIETPCCVRTCYFENDLLKPLYYEYFNRGARWLSAPTPMMRDELFDKTAIGASCAEEDGRIEIMFDAAQCLRFRQGHTLQCLHQEPLRWRRLAPERTGRAVQDPSGFDYRQPS